MALSPSIPTSFVPRATLQNAPRRPSSSGHNFFLMIALAIFFLMVIAAVAVLLYARYLNHARDEKAAELQQAQSSIDRNTVRDLIRLRDRFVSARTLLDSHIQLSGFFDVLEGVTLKNVQYDSLKVTVADDHSAKIEISGTAKNFNTLAAQSNAVAAEKRIRRGIFSDISLNKDNTVRFLLTADVDADLISGSTTPTIAAPVVTAPVVTPTTTPVAATTPAATTTTVKATTTPARVTTATTTP